MAIDILTVDAGTAETCGSTPRAATLRFESSPGMSCESAGDAAVTASAATTPVATTPSVLSDFVQLTKPRIVVMILVTTVATALMGAQGAVSLTKMVWLLLGTGFVAASAGAANQIWERVIDQRMTRTARRPLPAGRMSSGPAILYTALLGIAGTAILYLAFSPVPAAVGLATWLLYVLVYTPMKTRTAWNTTVGAIAGAIPMLIGYTATGGSLSDMTGWLLVGVLVAWQYPHFMAIAWIYRRQYAEAGFQMSTTVDPSGRSAAIQSIAGSVGLIACAIALCWIPVGWKAATLATLAVLWSGWPMLRASLQFACDPGDTLARSLLRKSLLVLPAVFAIITLRLFW